MTLIRRYSRDATRQLIGVTSLMATPQLLIVSFAVERNLLLWMPLGLQGFSERLDM